MQEVPQEALAQFSDSSRQCIKRLITYIQLTELSDISSQNPLRLAAVLLLLYEHSGKLRVLLTTRSKTLRTHAGQTALPGGKVDQLDKDLIETARREAHEEVGLPLNSPDIHVIGLLEPLLSIHKLVVTPVVAFLTRPEILKSLQAAEGEVAHIFSHPLEAILDPRKAEFEQLVPIGSEDWPYENEFYNTNDSVVPVMGNTTYRMHRFRTSASPVKGLTADILIKAAEIAFDRPTVYERYASEQVKGYAALMEILTRQEL